MLRILSILLVAAVSLTAHGERRKGLVPAAPLLPDSVVSDNFFWNRAADSLKGVADGPVACLEVRPLRTEKELKKALDKWDKRLPLLNLAGGTGPLSGPCSTQGAEALETAHDSWQLFLATGETRFMDVFERALFNGVLAAAGPREKPDVRRQAARWVKAAPLFAYAVADSCIYVNFFSRGSAGVLTPTIHATVTQITSYPWVNAAQFWVVTYRPGQRFSLRIRIPGWLRGAALPGKPRFSVSKRSKIPDVYINEEHVTPRVEDGYIVIDREWNYCDRIHIHSEAPILRLRSLGDDGKPVRGELAYQRGPLLYGHTGSMAGYYMSESEKVSNTFDNKKRNVFVFKTRRFQAAGVPADAAAPASDVELLPYYKCMEETPDSTFVWLPEVR